MRPHFFEHQPSSLKENPLQHKDARGRMGRIISSQSKWNFGPSDKPSDMLPSSSTRSTEPLLNKNKNREASSSSVKTSQMPSNPSSRAAGPLGDKFSISRAEFMLRYGDRFKEPLRPGKEISLGMLGTYQRNPKGLASFYDWDAEEGGYIPFQHQKAHRRRWLQEMKEQQQAEERVRLAKLEAILKKNAARRQAYDDHLASKRQD